MDTSSIAHKGRLLPVLVVLLAGCASLPPDVRRLPDDAETVELVDTPFHPQQRFQCGPAALLTALEASGVSVPLQTLVDKVYLPARQGSVRSEMLAATRTSGRVAYPIEGTLAALHAELEAGRPVVVLQNLGVAAFPRWHYAVVVGIDAHGDSVVLRSGTDRRRVTDIDTFLRTWRRSNYWGFVSLRPNESPARPERQRWFEAIAALEQAGQPAAAATAWTAVLDVWPGNTTALFGLANALFAGGDPERAVRVYRRLLVHDVDLLPARNNLALALSELGRIEDALHEIDLAIARAGESGLSAELSHTRALILARRASAE